MKKADYKIDLSEMHLSALDPKDEKFRQAVATISQKEEVIFIEAIKRHFGECDPFEMAKLCQISNIGGYKRLYHADVLICEIYPLHSSDEYKPDSNSFNLKFNYRY